MITRRVIPLVLLVLVTCFGFAQGPGSSRSDSMRSFSAALPAPAPVGMGHGMNLHGVSGRWWKNADIVKQLALSDEQVQKMEQVFQEHRLKLIDLRAALQREEVRMEPMLTAENPNESQVLGQIDKVAAQRANLEKANAQMAFAIRRVLTPEQWKTLQTVRQERRLSRFEGRKWKGNRQGRHPNVQPLPAPVEPAPPPAPAPQQ